MRLLILSFAVLLSGCALLESRPKPAVPGACLSSPARQFDFLLGEWDVRQRILQRDGQWVESDASAQVEIAMDGCAVVEHWSGEVQFFWAGMEQPRGLQAMIVRSYDGENQQWVINWMDSLNARFNSFRGRFGDNFAAFYRRTPGADGNEIITRVAYAQINSVQPGPLPIKWELALSSDSGKTWKPLWQQFLWRKGSRPEQALLK